MSASNKFSQRKPGWLSSLVALVVVFALLFGASRAAPEYKGDLGAIAALGFLLLGGALFAEVLEPLRMPHLTGYLLCGVIAGPHLLHLIDHETVQTLSKVNSLALALIALAGGAELRVSILRDSIKSLGWSMLVQTVVGVLLAGAMFFFLKPMLPFARDFGTGAMIAVALLWGVFAAARSPSAALGVLTQTRAQGPLARYALAFVMSSGIVTVVSLAAAFTIAKPLLVPGAEFSSTAFRTLGHDLIGSISIGTTLGLLLAAYVKLIEKQLLVVLLALGFGAWEVLGYLNFDPLLTFMVAGFVVQNLSKQGEKFLRQIDWTGGLVYVVFFATAGAHLDIPLLQKLWPVTLILCGGRALVTFVCARVSSALAKDEPQIRKWAFAPLIPQAGLALGMAALVEKQFPGFGSDFRALGVAAAAVNEIVGPILFKAALDATGESRPPSSSLPDQTEIGSSDATNIAPASQFAWRTRTLWWTLELLEWLRVRLPLRARRSIDAEAART
jgi:Kef-type K+ transport system membrane component KefB